MSQKLNGKELSKEEMRTLLNISFHVWEDVNAWRKQIGDIADKRIEDKYEPYRITDITWKQSTKFLQEIAKLTIKLDKELYEK